MSVKISALHRCMPTLLWDKRVRHHTLRGDPLEWLGKPAMKYGLYKATTIIIYQNYSKNPFPTDQVFHTPTPFLPLVALIFHLARERYTFSIQISLPSRHLT